MKAQWGYYMQIPSGALEVDELGSLLSMEINCPVHYPAFGKHLFECACGVIFPVYMVKTKNWDLMRRKHEEERNMIGG